MSVATVDANDDISKVTKYLSKDSVIVFLEENDVFCRLKKSRSDMCEDMNLQHGNKID